MATEKSESGGGGGLIVLILILAVLGFLSKHKAQIIDGLEIILAIGVGLSILYALSKLGGGGKKK
jgi:hypothetical protein